MPSDGKHTTDLRAAPNETETSRRARAAEAERARLCNNVHPVQTTGCDCLGHPLRCYDHPRDCGCTDVANPIDWPKDIAERIVNEIGNYGSPVFADGANLSRVAAIIRRRLEEAANADR
jgi:hypothetical protein